MALLAGLDQINWARLQHAYGPAVDVPDLLRALVDPEKATPKIKAAARKHKRGISAEAAEVLWSNIFHQGTVWQASAKTVPFFVEILRDGPDVIELRRFVVTYLHHLAMGYPEDAFPAPIDPSTYFAYADGLRDEGRAAELADYSVQERARASEKDLIDRLPCLWARDCYLAVEERLADIIPFVDSSDEELALETLALIASFPRHAEATLPRVRAVIAASKGLRKGVAMVVLGQLARSTARGEVEAAALSVDRVVAVLGACASVIAAADQVSEDAIRVLTAPLSDLADIDIGVTRTLSVLVGRCIARLPETHILRSVEALAKQHVGADPTTGLSLTSSILMLVFPGDRAPNSPKELTQRQRRALEAIRDHGAWTIGERTFGNYSMLLREYGLPNDRQRLTQWLLDCPSKGPKHD